MQIQSNVDILNEVEPSASLLKYELGILPLPKAVTTGGRVGWTNFAVDKPDKQHLGQVLSAVDSMHS